MAFLASLDEARQHLQDKYFVLSGHAAQAWQTEARAGLCLTAGARGFLLRQRLQRLGQHVRIIQRFWRGYQGRQRCKLATKARNARLRQAHFDFNATVIQSMFRGFYSRKYVHSMHTRRQYLLAALQRSSELREQAQEQVVADKTALQATNIAGRRSRFEQQAGKLHHLVSTHSQASVLAPPLQAIKGNLPRPQGATMEEHIRARHREQGRKVKRNRCESKCYCRVQVRASTQRASPARQPPPLQLDLLPSELLGSVQRRSLQSLPHFGRERAECAVAECAARRAVQFVHGRDFVAGGTASKPPLDTPTNRTLEPWVDGSGAASPCNNKLDTATTGSTHHSLPAFKSTWWPQRVLGQTLGQGEGI